MRPLLTRRELLRATMLSAGAFGASVLAACGSVSSSSNAASSATASSGSTVGLSEAASSIAAASSSQGPLLTFIVMSDTHITEDKERNVQHYRDALADIKSFETAPDTIVLLGDITDSGSEEQYKLFEELTAEAGYSYKDDLTLVMGNHDQLNAEYDPEKAGWDTQYMRFAEYAGSSKVYYDRMVKGQHFICMGPDRNDSGNWVRFGFSDEQLSWLQRQLDADKAAGRVSHVFCHEPLSNTVHTSRTETWLENNGLEDNDALFNIVAHRPNVVFYSGHTHTYPRVAQPDSSGPLYINDGAVATGQIAPDAYGFDTFSGAFGWLVTVYQDRIAFQMRNFLEGEWVDDLAFEHPIRL